MKRVRKRVSEGVEEEGEVLVVEVVVVVVVVVLPAVVSLQPHYYLVFPVIS